MARSDDIVDDVLRILQPLVPRDELWRVVIEMRQKWGGRSYYVRKGPPPNGATTEGQRRPRTMTR